MAIKVIKEGTKSYFLVEEKVRIKPKAETYLPGDDPTKHNKAIGSCMDQSGRSVTGFSLEEEVIYLKPLVKTNPDSEHWPKAVANYADNIHKIIDPNPDINGKVKGEELNISMKFTKETEAKEYEARYSNVPKDSNAKRFHQDYVDIVGNPMGGIPQNYADYAMWRYCLVYSKVANSPELRFKSNSIWFYLESDSVEKQKKLTNTNLRGEAYAIYLKIKDNTEATRQILRVLGENVSLMDSVDIATAIEEAAMKRPADFLKVTKKGYDYEMAAFIKQCIELNIMEVIPNTEAIQLSFGERSTIGKNLEEASTYLKKADKEVKELMESLKLQVSNLTKN